MKQILAGLACFAFGTAVADILPLRFDGGKGTSQVDQFAGTGGDGWAGAWVSRNLNGDITTHVVDTNPLTAGGGNYLSVAGSSPASENSNRYYNIGRQYDSSTGLALNAYHEVSFEFRLDAIVATRINNSNTYFNFFDRPGTVTGDGDSVVSYDFSTDGRWLIRNYPGTQGLSGTGQGNFLLYNGEKNSGGFPAARFVDSGVTMNPDEVYRFTILLNPDRGGMAGPHPKPDGRHRLSECCAGLSNKPNLRQRRTDVWIPGCSRGRKSHLFHGQCVRGHPRTRKSDIAGPWVWGLHCIQAARKINIP